jgi:hypothetical protein
MASMCRGMMGNVPFGLFFVVLGIALLAGGAIVLLEPRALLWLLAGTSIMLGLATLTAAVFVGRFMARSRDAHRL